MAMKRTYGSHSTVTRCPNCGEDYSVTYKRCPFCDEKAREQEADHRYDNEYNKEFDDGWDEENTAPLPRSGGKRLARGSSPQRNQGGGDWSMLKILGTVVSLVFIIAAIWIVVTQIVPLIRRGEVDPVDPLPPVTSTTTPTTAPMDTDEPVVSPTPGPEDPALVIPDSQTATGFTLDKSDFTINDSFPDPVKLKITFAPAGTTGSITWSSSDESVATVSSDGTITPTRKSGSATITATMAGGHTQTCVVRCSFSGGEGGGTISTGNLSLNREDFSLQRAGETFQMKVSGTSSTPTWSIGNTTVATISGSGTVTAVGKGNTTITCTVDGKTLTCIVRCSF